MSKLALELLQLHVAQVDARGSLLAEDYGFLASALAAVSWSVLAPVLTEALRRARARREREVGYTLYTRRMPCSFVDRLSLPELLSLDLGVTPALQFRRLIHAACEAMNDAWEHIWDFSDDPLRAECLLRADYQLFLAWVAAAASLYAAADLGDLQLLDGRRRSRSYESCLALMRACVYHAAL